MLHHHTDRDVDWSLCCATIYLVYAGTCTRSAPSAFKTSSLCSGCCSSFTFSNSVIPEIAPYDLHISLILQLCRKYIVSHVQLRSVHWRIFALPSWLTRPVILFAFMYVQTDKNLQSSSSPCLETRHVANKMSGASTLVEGYNELLVSKSKSSNLMLLLHLQWAVEEILMKKLVVLKGQNLEKCCLVASAFRDSSFFTWHPSRKILTPKSFWALRSHVIFSHFI